jgi:phage tail-like protein
LSGQNKFGNVTLKWGITDSTSLYEWYRAVVDQGADANKRNMAIILVDEVGSEKSRWDFTNAWPMKYKGTDFNAKNNDVAIETLEIVSEEFVRVS